VGFERAKRSVRASRGWQMALMIVNIVVNSIIGVIFPLVFIISWAHGDLPCFPGEGKEEKKFINVRRYLSS
jgi:hypothetical protein